MFTFVGRCVWVFVFMCVHSCGGLNFDRLSLLISLSLLDTLVVKLDCYEITAELPQPLSLGLSPETTVFWDNLLHRIAWPRPYHSPPQLITFTVSKPLYKLQILLPLLIAPPRLAEWQCPHHLCSKKLHLLRLDIFFPAFCIYILYPISNILMFVYQGRTFHWTYRSLILALLLAWLLRGRSLCSSERGLEGAGCWGWPLDLWRDLYSLNCLIGPQKIS